MRHNDSVMILAMKNISVYITMSFLVISAGLSSCTNKRSSEALTAAHNEIINLNLQVSGDSQVIYDAAAEFFARNNAGNKFTVLSLYSLATNAPIKIMRYVDEDYAVLVLPVPVGGESGYFRFAHAYNWIALNTADRYALDGEYKKAVEIYRLVERCCGSSRLTDDIEQRLSLVGQLQSDEKVELNRLALAKLIYTPAPSILSHECPIEEISTNSLLNVDFREQWKSPKVRVERFEE